MCIDDWQTRKDNAFFILPSEVHCVTASTRTAEGGRRTKGGGDGWRDEGIAGTAVAMQLLIFSAVDGGKSLTYSVEREEGEEEIKQSW